MLAETEREKQREATLRIELALAEQQNIAKESKRMRAKESLVHAETARDKQREATDKQREATLQVELALAEQQKLANEKETLRARESLAEAETRRDKQRESTMRADIELAQCCGTLECVVCLSDIATHIVLPCCHLALCADCAKCSVTVCPVCRTPTEKISRLYLPSK